MIRIWPHRTYGVVILFLLACFLHYFFWHVDVAYTTTKKEEGETVPTYRFPPIYAGQVIPHLTPINPSTLIPRGSYPIDAAHRNGYLHTGHCLFIMDESGLLLFLKRSSDVVTCPSTWSILGEHSIENELAHDTVIRGMEEELGLKKQVSTLGTNDPSIEADFQTMSNNSISIHVAIQNITQYPLYYIRHYGPRLDNRIDSQLTYLWLARLPKRHDEIQIKLDDEVADHKWISLEEFSDWIEADARDHDKEEEEEEHNLRHHDGKKDDGPPSGDFCHHTIRSLYAKGLENLKLMI